MKKPNILMFMTDQQRADTCFGRAIMPNLAAFRRECASFTDVMCTAPHCCPSRTSMFSGLYPSQHGVWNNVDVGNAISRGMASGVRLWPEDLRDNGYKMFYSGKWHLSSEEGPDAFGFELLYHPKKYTGVTDTKTSRLPHTHEWEAYIEGDTCSEQDERRPGEIIRPGYPHYFLYGENSGNTGDENTVNAAVERLAHLPKEPWFIFCGPVGPHDPYFVPREYLDMYDIRDISLPDTYADEMKDKPAFYRKTRAPFDQLTCDEVREGIRHYLAYCTYEDMLFGRVLDALRKSGQYDDTIILYCSDHGDYAGEHGLWAKGLPCFRSAYHVPLFIRVPGTEKPITIDTPAMLTDIGPTLLDLCGVKCGRPLMGMSLRPWIEDREEKPAEREYRFTQTNGNEQYGIQRAVWGKDWKYVYNGFDYDELYDLKNDPGETENLAADARFRPVIKDLLRVMWQFVRDTDDTILNTYILSAHAPFGPGILFRE